MRRGPLLFFQAAAAALASAGPLAAAPEPHPPAREFAVIDTVISGSWEDTDELLRDRATLRVTALGLSLRAAILDIRGPTPDDLDDGKTRFAYGAYHQGTSSRLVYGAVEQSGLARRIASPFGRAIPLADDHKAEEVDIDPDAPIDRKPSLHASLGTPRRLPLRTLASVTVDPEKNYITTASAEASGRHASFLRLQAAYSHRDLAKRELDAWFSEEPPLPARLHRVYGAGAVASSPIAAIAADAAVSDTYGEGAGGYGNAGLRFGDMPWRLFLAADGASPRYRGPDGAETGIRFRTITRIELSTGRTGGSLFRADFRTTHPAANRTPDGMSAALAFRRDRTSLIALERAAILGEWTIDGTGPLIDAAETEAALALGPFDVTGTFRTTFEPAPEGLGGRLWESSAIRIHVSTSFGPVEIRAGAGRMITEEADAVTQLTLGAKFSWLGTETGFKLTFDEVPGPASLRLTWRVRQRVRIPLQAGGTS